MLANLNYIHILVAAVVYFLIGSLWFSVLFGKIWLQLVGLTITEDDKKNMLKMFSTTFVLNFVTSFSTACIIYFVQPNTIVAALKLGGLIALGFVGAPNYINYMYAKRPTKLIAIDAGYHVFSILIISVILTLWK